MRAQGKSPEVAAVLAWLVPGAGHLYAGHKVKGAGGLVFVLGLFLCGLWLSGGEAVSLRDRFGHPYAFLAQVGAGGPTGLGLLISRKHHYPQSEEELRSLEYTRGYPDRDTGLLFTMIAGLLNLLLVHDALNGVPGALGRRRDERLRRKRLDALREELLAERAGQSEEAANEAEPLAPKDEPSTGSGPDDEPPTDPGTENEPSTDSGNSEGGEPAVADSGEGEGETS
jgi:hypothetical protein